MSVNPFGEFREECSKLLRITLTKGCPKILIPSLQLEPPPSQEFGELASSLCLEIAKKFGVKPIELARKIVKTMDPSKTRLVQSVEAAGAGYINFHANYTNLSSLTIKSATALNQSYGYVKTDKPLKTIVEHTSANPGGPIHVGTARNSIIGDSLARILKSRGHHVATHFYIDDVGRQIAVVAYGYKLLGQPEPVGKTDHWIGFIYATTSCITAIQALKPKIQELKDTPGAGRDLRKLQEELDDWVAAAADLRERDTKTFDYLLEKIREDRDPEASISDIMRRYEGGDPKTKALVRRVVRYCIQGFKETYDRVGISWDSWDWESDLVWKGRVSRAIRDLRETPFFTESQGVSAVDVEGIAESLKLKKLFGIPEEHEIPPLTLVRSDGTTLYTTRDIAYSFWKFERADRVINVIGTDQTLPQLQLKMVVSLLSSPEKAQNLIHYAYEMVELPGYKMSRRRGRYVIFDEIVDEATKRAYEEVEKRSPHLSAEEKQKISESVGVGAVKYAILNVAPLKPVVFTWEKVLNFDINSAPFIQYAFARACNILKKANTTPKEPNFSLLTHQLERDLVLMVARFPEVFVDAAENLKPTSIAEFANDLADKFNSFYASLPVIQAETPELRDARLALVDAIRVTLRNSLNLLGIEALERM